VKADWHKTELMMMCIMRPTLSELPNGSAMSKQSAADIRPHSPSSS